MPYFLSTLLLLAVALLVSVFLVDRLIPVLRAWHQVDEPNHRTLHTGSIPRGGGIVIVFMTLLAMLWAIFFSATPLLFTAIMIIMLGWAVLGWTDDVYDLSPKLRFLIQFLLAFAAIAAIGWINHLTLSPQTVIQLGWWGLPMSVLGIVWMANLYNFMDGMDGMAASQAIVAATTFAFWFLGHGGTEMAVICAVIAAASYGFLWHNWRPASIFMGDVGSIFLGAVFALLLIVGHNRFDIPVLSSVLLLLVFIGDSMLTLILRVRRGEKVWQAHSSHFYQRLAHAGYSHAYIVVAYIGLMIVCSLAATVSLYQQELLLPISAGLALLVTLLAIGVSIVTRTKPE